MKSKNKAPKGSETRKPGIFWLLAVFVIPIWSLISKTVILNPENLPSKGGCIIAANHVTEIDPLGVGVALWYRGRLSRFMAKDSLFKGKIVGYLLNKSGQIPVIRNNGYGSKNTMNDATRLVQSGGLLVIYPEGTLTRDPNMWPMKGKNGVIRLAIQSGVPIIPLGHWGAQNILPRYSKKVSLFPRKKVSFAFGQAIDVKSLVKDINDSKQISEATDVVMQKITELVAKIRNENPPSKI